MQPPLLHGQQLSLVLDAARIGTWEWDIARDRIQWSENFEELHGFERGAFGNSLAIYQKNIHPEDRERIAAALRDCAAGVADYAVEYRLIAPGGVHYVEAHGRLVDDTRLIGVCRDVSDKVRSARRYFTLAQELPAHVWTAKPDGNLDFVNDRVVAYFGRSAEQIIGGGWLDVVHPADRANAVARWTHSLSTGEPYEVEFRLRRADGAYRWYLGRARPIRDERGDIVQWLGTNTDIDDKKRALALTTTQIEVAELLVNARALNDVATSILETVCRNLGWTCAQLWVVDRASDVLRRSASWCDGTSMRPIDFAALDEFMEMKRGVGLPGRIWATKAPAWISDVQIDANFPRAAIMQRIGVRSAFGFPLIVTGEVSAVLELFTSERREIEESTIALAAPFGNQIGHFIERQAVEQDLSDALGRLDRLQNVTAAALSHLSLNELLDDLLGRICSAVGADVGFVLLLDRERLDLYPVATVGGSLPPDFRLDVGESRAAMNRELQTRRHISTDLSMPPEIRALGIESAVAIPLLNAEELIGVLMVGSTTDKPFESDETHFMELVGQRLANAIANSSLYEHAREANRVKDRFISVASHELRTPMTGILGWTMLLRNEADPEVRAEALNWIEKSVRTQAQLIEDLLDSTRIREGKLELRREVIDLRDAVRGALQTVASHASEHGVIVESSLPDHAVEVFGDSMRLEQVTWNLLGNAIKFTPAGKCVRATLSVDDAHAIVVVADEGAGIDSDFLPNVFKAFEQDKKGKRAGGLGLGLHIVATIVALHGGTIAAASDGPGLGASFTVRLPLRVA